MTHEILAVKAKIRACSPTLSPQPCYDEQKKETSLDKLKKYEGGFNSFIVSVNFVKEFSDWQVNPTQERPSKNSFSENDGTKKWTEYLPNKFKAKVDFMELAEINKVPSLRILADKYVAESNYTNLQRDDQEKVLKGKIVEWEVPIYEVNRIKSSKVHFHIIVRADKRHDKQYNPKKPRYPGMEIEIFARTKRETQKIEKLKTGSLISFKGRITGVTSVWRRIEIEDAILTTK